MAGYILRRMVEMIPTLWMIYTILFMLGYLMPGDPVCVVYGEECERLDEATRQAIREELGLERALPAQYLDFLGRLARLDLGESYIHREPVADIIGYRLPRTLQLMAGGMLVALALGIPVGLLGGAMPHTRLDHLLTLATLLVVSMPVFWQAYLAQLYLTQSKYGVRLFPSAGYGDGDLRYMVLPALVLGLGLAAVIARILRAALIETRDEDYSTTARAKGVPVYRVVARHQLPNAFIPVLTIIGVQVGGLMTGALLVEVIFNWPGLGRALVSAILRRDTPVFMGILIYGALVYLAVNLVIDILYALIDPRIRYHES